MGLLSWDEAFNTGDAEINKQHRKLFRLVNEFGEIENFSESIDLALKFEVIVDYFAMHLSEEEAYLRDCDNTEYYNYQMNQDNLLSVAEGLESKLRDDAANIYRTANMFLNHVVKLHVTKTHQSVASEWRIKQSA